MLSFALTMSSASRTTKFGGFATTKLHAATINSATAVPFISLDFGQNVQITQWKLFPISSCSEQNCGLLSTLNEMSNTFIKHKVFLIYVVGWLGFAEDLNREMYCNVLTHLGIGSHKCEIPECDNKFRQISGLK